MHVYTFLSVSRDKDIEPGAFIKLRGCLAQKESHLYLFNLVIVFVRLKFFFFKTMRFILFYFFFLNPNMKSFWFNEDEIHRGRNRLRWLRIYWSRRLDIDYHGVTRLSPASSQWEGPTSDLTLRRMNSEVHTLFRTPLNASPLPPHSGTIRHTYILFQWFGAKCEKRRAHRYHGISMKVKTF